MSMVGQWCISGKDADGSVLKLGPCASTWVDGGSGNEPEWEWITEGLEHHGFLNYGDTLIAERLVAARDHTGYDKFRTNIGFRRLYSREVRTRTWVGDEWETA